MHIVTERRRPGAIGARNRDGPGDARLQRDGDFVVVLAAHRGRAVRICGVDLPGERLRDLRAVQAVLSDLIPGAADLYPVDVQAQRSGTGAIRTRHHDVAEWLERLQQDGNLVAVLAAHKRGAERIGQVDLSRDSLGDSGAIQTILLDAIDVVPASRLALDLHVMRIIGVALPPHRLDAGLVVALPPHCLHAGCARTLPPDILLAGGCGLLPPDILDAGTTTAGRNAVIERAVLIPQRHAVAHLRRAHVEREGPDSRRCGRKVPSPSGSAGAEAGCRSHRRR